MSWTNVDEVFLSHCNKSNANLIQCTFRGRNKNSVLKTKNNLKERQTYDDVTNNIVSSIIQFGIIR